MPKKSEADKLPVITIQDGRNDSVMRCVPLGYIQGFLQSVMLAARVGLNEKSHVKALQLIDEMCEGEIKKL